MTDILFTMVLLAAAQSGPGPSIGTRIDMRDRAQAVTPVTGYFLLPPKIPDCRTQAQVDEAVRAKQDGYFERCDPERFLRARR